MTLRNLHFTEMLFLDENEGATAPLVRVEIAKASARAKVLSRADGDGSDQWLTHAVIDYQPAAGGDFLQVVSVTVKTNMAAEGSVATKARAGVLLPRSPLLFQLLLCFASAVVLILTSSEPVYHAPTSCLLSYL